MIRLPYGEITMQLIKNGPDIPDRLLQIHEEGHVVFFCEAGISFPARLPGFKGLISRVYEELGGTSDRQRPRRSSEDFMIPSWDWWKLA